MKYVELPFQNDAELTDKIFEQSRKLLSQAGDDDGVLLHCGSANRVGALWMVHRVMDGRMAIEEARNEAARVGLRNEAYEAKALDYLKRKGKK